MPAFIDLTGQRFGKLTVLERTKDVKSKNTYYICICDCGNQTIVRGSHLTNGTTKNCGCLIKESNITHGESYTPLYGAWNRMKMRCYDENYPSYKYYHEYGITVCDEWINDYTSFRDWSLNNGYEKGLTLDRIDNTLGYNPDNCRWTTQKVQQNNKRNNIYVTYFNETHTLAEWCDILNLPYKIIYQRIHRYNMDFWTAISTPLPDHYYEDCYNYDYSNEYYEDPYEYDNCIYDE